MKETGLKRLLIVSFYACEVSRKGKSIERKDQQFLSAEGMMGYSGVSDKGFGVSFRGHEMFLSYGVCIHL